MIHRARIVVNGRVQGVGYRNWIHTQARTLKLRGWVKNISDGSVEIVAEGEEESINSLVSLARRGPRLARVDSVETHWSTESAGEFTDFQVRR